MLNPNRYRYRSTRRTTMAKRITTVRNRDSEGNLIDEYTYGGEGEDEYSSPDQWCTDTVGYRYKDNPLYLSYQLMSPSRASVHFNEHYDDPWGSSDYTFDYDVGLPFSHAIYPGDEDVSDVEFVTKAAAETNPSAAHVQGLVFAAELRDLPSLFQSVGHNLTKFGANEYLKFQYGWKPFIKDMRKMFDISDRVHRRLHAIQKIDREQVVRRRYRPNANIGGYDYTAREGWVASGDMIAGGLLGVWGHTEMRTHRWADTIWLAKPPETLFSFGGNEQIDRARKALFGLNVDGPSLWQAMPWSWLADWTYNVSDYLESQNNVVGAEFGEAILMKTTELSTLGLPSWQYPPESGDHPIDAYLGMTRTIVKERILGIEPAVVNTGDRKSVV